MQGGAAERLDSLGAALHRPPGSRQKGQGTLGGDLWKETNRISGGSERMRAAAEREGRRFHQYGGQQALIRQLSLSSCTGVVGGTLSRVGLSSSSSHRWLQKTGLAPISRNSLLPPSSKVAGSISLSLCLCCPRC